MRQAVREWAIAMRLQPGRPDQDRHRGERARAQHAHVRRRRHGPSRALNDGTRRGLRLVFEDQGPGIADIELALRDGYTTGGGLGLGLGGARRLVERVRDRLAAGRGHAGDDHAMEVTEHASIEIATRAHVGAARAGARSSSRAARLRRDDDRAASARRDRGGDEPREARRRRRAAAAHARDRWRRAAVEHRSRSTAVRAFSNRAEADARRILDRRHAGHRARRDPRVSSTLFDIYSLRRRGHGAPGDRLAGGAAGDGLRTAGERRINVAVSGRGRVGRRLGGRRRRRAHARARVRRPRPRPARRRGLATQAVERLSPAQRRGAGRDRSTRIHDGAPPDARRRGRGRRDRRGTGVVRFAGIGNIAGTILADGTTRSLVSHHGTAGHDVRRGPGVHLPVAAGAIARAALRRPRRRTGPSTAIRACAARASDARRRRPLPRLPPRPRRHDRRRAAGGRVSPRILHGRASATSATSCSRASARARSRACSASTSRTRRASRPRCRRSRATRSSTRAAATSSSASRARTPPQLLVVRDRRRGPGHRRPRAHPRRAATARRPAWASGIVGARRLDGSASRSRRARRRARRSC